MVIWQLRGGAHARQRPALRAIAVTFYALAAYVAFESIRDLVTQDKAGESLIGIVLNVVALIVMIPVALTPAAHRAGAEQPRAGRPVHRNVDVQRPVHHCAGRAGTQRRDRLVVGRPRGRPGRCPARSALGPRGLARSRRGDEPSACHHTLWARSARDQLS